MKDQVWVIFNNTVVHSYLEYVLNGELRCTIHDQQWTTSKCYPSRLAALLERTKQYNNDFLDTQNDIIWNTIQSIIMNKEQLTITDGQRRANANNYIVYVCKKGDDWYHVAQHNYEKRHGVVKHILKPQS